MAATMSAQDVTLLESPLGSLDAAEQIAAAFANTFIVGVSAAAAYVSGAVSKNSMSFPAITDRPASGTLGGKTPPSAGWGAQSAPAFVDLSAGGQLVFRGAKIVPYGSKDDGGGQAAGDATFSIRIFGWTLFEQDALVSFWHPILLAEVECTLSVDLPIAIAPAASLFSYCDDITLTDTSGNQNVSCEIIAPQNGTPAHLIVDAKGSRFLELQFSREGSGEGIADKGNALVKLI